MWLVLFYLFWWRGIRGSIGSTSRPDSRWYTCTRQTDPLAPDVGALGPPGSSESGRSDLFDRCRHRPEDVLYLIVDHVDDVLQALQSREVNSRESASLIVVWMLTEVGLPNWRPIIMSSPL